MKRAETKKKNKCRKEFYNLIIFHIRSLINYDDKLH